MADGVKNNKTLEWEKRFYSRIDEMTNQLIGKIGMCNDPYIYDYFTGQPLLEVGSLYMIIKLEFFSTNPLSSRLKSETRLKAVLLNMRNGHKRTVIIRDTRQGIRHDTRNTKSTLPHGRLLHRLVNQYAIVNKKEWKKVGNQ